MRVQWVAVAVAAAALATSLASQNPRKHPPPDDRRLGPMIHRAGPAELAVRDRVAQQEAVKIRAKRQLRLASVPSTTWVNLGPTDAFSEYNDANIAGVDSGRPNAIAVD